MLTTARYASPSIRLLTVQLAQTLGLVYMARGKKTVEQLAACARRKGYARMGIVHGKGGKAEELELAAVDETGAWNWAGKVTIRYEDPGRTDD